MRLFQQRLLTMKSNLLCAIPLGVLLVLALASRPAQAQLGIGGGFNYDQLEDLRASSVEATFENATGYHIGVFYDLSLGPFALRPGAFYRRIGAYAFHVPAGSNLPGVATEEFDVNLVEIPIDVRFRFFALPFIKPYVLAGPVITIPQAEGELSDGMEEAHMTADVGAGLEVQLPGLGLVLMPELRYGVGATRFFRDEFEIGGTTISPQEDPRLDSVMLRLNVRF